MLDPKVLLVCAVLAGGYEVYAHALKPAAVKVAHLTKAGAIRVVHLFTRG